MFHIYKINNIPYYRTQPNQSHHIGTEITSPWSVFISYPMQNTNQTL